MVHRRSKLIRSFDTKAEPQTGACNLHAQPLRPGATLPSHPTGLSNWYATYGFMATIFGGSCVQLPCCSTFGSQRELSQPANVLGITEKSLFFWTRKLIFHWTNRAPSCAPFVLLLRPPRLPTSRMSLPTTETKTCARNLLCTFLCSVVTVTFFQVHVHHSIQEQIASGKH